MTSHDLPPEDTDGPSLWGALRDLWWVVTHGREAGWWPW